MIPTLILAVALSRGPVYPQQWACIKECIQHPLNADTVNSWLSVVPYDKLARKPNVEFGIKITFGGKHK